MVVGKDGGYVDRMCVIDGDDINSEVMGEVG